MAPFVSTAPGFTSLLSTLSKGTSVIPVSMAISESLAAAVVV